MKVTLRSVYAEPGGVDALYDLLRERSEEDDPHTNISHRVLPPYSVHTKFVRSIPYRAWYFVKVDGLIAGSVNISKRNEIGIILSADYRGKGIGQAALKLLIARRRPGPAIAAHRSGRFLANVNPENKRSIRLLTSLGFKLIQHTYALEEEA